MLRNKFCLSNYFFISIDFLPLISFFSSLTYSYINLQVYFIEANFTFWLPLLGLSFFRAAVHNHHHIPTFLSSDSFFEFIFNHPRTLLSAPPQFLLFHGTTRTFLYSIIYLRYNLTRPYSHSSATLNLKPSIIPTKLYHLNNRPSSHCSYTIPSLFSSPQPTNSCSSTLIAPKSSSTRDALLCLFTSTVLSIPSLKRFSTSS